MKKIKNYLLSLVAIIFLLSGFKSEASHLMGSDLVYRHISGNTYIVVYKVYRDCSSLVGIGDVNLVVSRDTNGSAVITRSMTLVSKTTGTPYCKALQINNLCSENGLPNYEEHIFNATITLPGPHRRWCFSVSLNARPLSRNLVNANLENLYSRALLNNTNGLVNNSPSFNSSDVVVPFVCLNEETTHSFSTIESDGDSLSFSLIQPFANFNTRVAYDNYDDGLIFNKDSSKFVYFSVGTHTSNFPIPSFKIDSSRTPWRARRFFDLDRSTGSVTFNPVQYYPNATSQSGRNKYVVSVEIKEWRNVGGNWVFVGSIQRDLLFVVYDCGGNKLPKSPNVSIDPRTNSRVFTDSVTIINAQTCNMTLSKIMFRDPNANDTLNVTFPYTTLNDLLSTGFIDSASLDSNKTPTPNLIIRVRPNRIDKDKTYSFLTLIEDDGCPIKGIQRRIIRINIIDTNYGLALNSIGGINDTICRGDFVQLNARTLRPDSLFGAPQKYFYEWESAEGLDNSDRNKNSIVVNPNFTTKYKVKITSGGFDGCFDTATIEVKVREPIEAKFNTIYLQNNIGDPLSSPINISVKNISTNRHDIDSIMWNFQKYVSDRWITIDTHSTFEIPSIFIDDLGNYKLTLRVWARVNEKWICGSQYSEKINVSKYILPNIITPNGDGRNDVFVTQSMDNISSVKIYNRWGILVRDYESYKNNFDATDLNSGVYFYIINFNNDFGTEKGWIEVIK